MKNLLRPLNLNIAIAAEINRVASNFQHPLGYCIVYGLLVRK